MGNGLGTFLIAKSQIKFLLVIVDYFTKWIEAEPLAKIITQKVQKFTWKSIICSYGLPQAIITDKGRQFIEKGYEEFLKQLRINSLTSLVEHPQTNGQAKIVNKVTLAELQKRL